MERQAQEALWALVIMLIEKMGPGIIEALGALIVKILQGSSPAEQVAKLTNLADTVEMA